MAAVDEYFASLEQADRNAFEHIRKIVVLLAPDAEQATSYGMAAFRYRGKPLLGFKAAKNHLSVFPFSPEAVDAARGRLEGFDLAKGTVRFSAASPLPDEAVRAMVRHRMAEIDG
ncbi:MAG: DUF1801 domain-containing protein [Hamadaea sp.]|nr:DUF1801 domain-containing protein [Hamadaea sp.]